MPYAGWPLFPLRSKRIGPETSQQAGGRNTPKNNCAELSGVTQQDKPPQE